MWKKAELDPLEVAKLVATVVGAAVIYYTLQTAEARKTELESVALVQKALPVLDNNYTNRMSTDRRYINVKMVHRVRSEGPTYIASPIVRLYSDGMLVSWLDYKTENRTQLSGTFAGGVTQAVQYRIALCEGVADLPKLEVEFSYFAEMPLAYQKLYKPILLKLRPDGPTVKADQQEYPEIRPAVASCVERPVQPIEQEPPLSAAAQAEIDYLNSLWRVNYMYREPVKVFEENPGFADWGGDAFDWL